MRRDDDLAEKQPSGISKWGGARDNAGGKRIGAGRRKGIPNKISGDVKAMILAALDRKGGAAYLEEQAEKNPVAFMSLVGKVLPMTVAGDPTSPVRIAIVSGVPRPDEDAEEVNGHANGHNGHAGAH